MQQHRKTMALVKPKGHLCQSQYASHKTVEETKEKFFFWAHAVRARGSDGHQNVLSGIGCSHMLENRWEQKPRCLQNNTHKNSKTTQPKPKPTQPKRHPGNCVKHYAFRKSLSRSDCFAMSQQFPHIDVPSDSKSWSADRWWSCIISVIEQGWEVGSPTSTWMKLHKAGEPLRWRKQKRSFHCWPLIEYFVWIRWAAASSWKNDKPELISDNFVPSWPLKVTTIRWSLHTLTMNHAILWNFRNGRWRENLALSDRDQLQAFRLSLICNWEPRALGFAKMPSICL